MIHIMAVGKGEQRQGFWNKKRQQRGLKKIKIERGKR